MPAVCRSPTRFDSFHFRARPYFSYRKIAFQMLRNIPALRRARSRARASERECEGARSSLINEVSSDTPSPSHEFNKGGRIKR